MPVCKGHDWCYRSQKKRQTPCDICGNLIHPGSVYVPEYTDYDTPVVDHEHESGQRVPEARGYFCADCFRYTRPENSRCNCPASLDYYEKHERERLANPGMVWMREKSLRPSGPRPGTALAIPSPSAAASVSASSGGDINVDRPNLVHVVERLQQEITEMSEHLQQEMREMKEQIATLENAVRRILIQTVLPAQWQSRMQ